MSDNEKEPWMYSQKPKQQDLFYGDTRFLLMLTSLISSGRASLLGGDPILVYLILKCNADYVTSRASVGTARIKELSGIRSQKTIMSCLQKLEEHQLIKRINPNESGKRSVYEISDPVYLYDKDGSFAGNAIVPYRPKHLGEQISELKENFLRNGVVPSNSTIKFNITIVHNTDKGTVNINNGDSNSNIDLETFLNSLNNLPADMRKAFTSRIAKKDGA